MTTTPTNRSGVRDEPSDPSTPSTGARTLAAALRGRPDSTAGRPGLLRAVRQAAEAVGGLHARGLIHRDLNPERVDLGPDGSVAVTGPTSPPAAAPGRVDPATAETIAKRSGYVAPELARVELGRVDARADVFALGSILCEVLTGRPAFVGDDPGDVRRAAASADLGDAFARLDACEADPALVAVVKRALSPEPEGRPADAAALADAIDACDASLPARLIAAEAARRTAEGRAAAAEADAAAVRRRRARTVLATAAVGLVLAGLGSAGSAALVRWRQLKIGRVDAALAQAAVLGTLAVDAPEGNPARLDEARALARAAVVEARGVPAGGAAVGRAVALSGRLDAAAGSADADRRAVDRLDAARARFDVETGDVETVFAAAFRDAGVDPAAPAAALAGRPARVAGAFVGALDAWAVAAADGDRRKSRAAAAGAVDPDPWRQKVRAAAAARDAAACRKFSLDETLASQPPGTPWLLARSLEALGETRTAVDVLNLALRRHPGDYWLNCELGRAHLSALKENPSAPPVVAAEVARRAEPAFRAALAVRPGFATAFAQFAAAVKTQGRGEEAAAALRQAVALRPDDPAQLIDLGNLLNAQGKPTEALAVLRKAVAIAPGDALAHANLGTSLHMLNRLDDAVAAYQAAVRIKPDSAVALSNIGTTRLRQGRLEEAEAAVRQAIKVKPDLVAGQFNLGTVLEARDRPDEAAAAYEAAVKLQPTFALAHKADGDVLARLGRYEKALAAYAEALRLSPDLPGLRAAVAVVRRRSELAPRLDAVVRGSDKPATPAEGVDFAGLAADHGRPAAAATLAAAAFAAEPKLGEDLGAANRYYAARSAARAGVGLGRDDPALTEADRARWRTQALDWLRADLALRGRQLATATAPAYREVRQVLSVWKQEPGFAPYRDGSGLPEAERAAWRDLWAQVDARLAQIDGATAR